MSIPDPRLNVLANICHSKKVVYDEMEFIDVAGLIKGAHNGEGLGNQFLSTIRQVSVILHVVRCFDNTGILHVNNKIDPINGSHRCRLSSLDIETIKMELQLADLSQLQKQREKVCPVAQYYA